MAVSGNDTKMHLEEKRCPRGLERVQILKWMDRVELMGFSYVVASLQASLTKNKGREKLMMGRQIRWNSREPGIDCARG